MLGWSYTQDDVHQSCLMLEHAHRSIELARLPTLLRLTVVTFMESAVSFVRVKWVRHVILFASASFWL